VGGIDFEGAKRPVLCVEVLGNEEHKKTDSELMPVQASITSANQKPGNHREFSFHHISQSEAGNGKKYREF